MTTAQSFINRFNDIKTLPHIAIRLSKMISDDTGSVDEFETIIRLDPTLVIRLLRLVNSSYYGLREKVGSISEAITFIGFASLRNMVVMEALKSIFKLGRDETGFSMKGLWFHCSAVSLCSQMISERVFGKTGENAFLCGILHDVGMIVESQVETDLFNKVCDACNDEPGPVTQYEDRIINTNHCEIGELLAREWNLPKDVQQGIHDHHLLLDDLEPSSLTGIIQIAEYVTARLNYTALPGMKVMLSPPLMSHIRDNVDEYRIITKDMPGEFKKANAIYDLNAE